MSSEEATSEEPRTWRELAVARSLDPARARAEHRVQRYLDAAVELLNSDGGEFTVQEVVERSGQSLRGFYQYFAGKHELLLAVFEEAIRATAEHLREAVDGEQQPLERVHRFVVEYYAMCQPSPKGRGAKKRSAPVVMAEFAQQLLTSHPKEASRAFVPLVSLFEGLLSDAQRAGGWRADMDVRRLAGVVLESVMFNPFARTISGLSTRSDGDDADFLWNFFLAGMGK
jgi:AcrR family transcriptional regulator